MRKKFINHPAYQGEGRRKEDDNMKLTNIAMRFLPYIVIIVGTIAVAQWRVGANEKNIETHTEKIGVLETDTTTLKAQLPAMKEDISEIKTCQQVIQTDIKDILKGIRAINGR